MARALSPTMSFGRPGRCTSPAEIMVVMPPLSPDSMKSMVRWRGVKSPKTGWQCESMSPGTTVLPRASMTMSASSSSPRPIATILPPSATIESPSISGRAMSPDTICPMFLISVFKGFLRTPGSHRQILPPQPLIPHQGRHGPVEANLPLLDDVGPVGQPRRELEILLGEQDRQALPLERRDLIPERAHDHRGQALRWLVEQQHPRVAHEGAGHRQHLLLASREAPGPAPRHLAQLGEELVDPGRVPGARALPADHQVLRDGQVAEDAPLLGHVAD